MSSVAEIEVAIEKLSAEEFVALESWFDAKRQGHWDRQIDEDSASGAFDALLREVEQDIAQGRTRPTDEICDHC